MSGYFCNNETTCIHKGKLKKILEIDCKGRHKRKVQICKNARRDCTCRYRVNLSDAFKF